MIATIYDPTTGEFLWTIDGPEIVPAAQGELVLGWVEGEWNPDTHYAVNDAATARPAIGLAETVTVAVGGSLATGAPAGTRVILDGEDVGETGPGVPLKFDMADTYAITLRPPFPWRERACVVTVT